MFGFSLFYRTGIPSRVDISKCPQCVNQREQVIDWEADTMIGKNHQGTLLTLDERKSKLRLALPYHLWERGQNENMYL